MRINDLEQYTRRNSVRIYGIDDQNNRETPAETTSKIIQMFNNNLEIQVKEYDIDIAHRLGPFKSDANRPNICKFLSRTLRTEVIRARRKLKGTRIIIKDDLTLKNQKLLQEAAAVGNVQSAWSDNGRIIVLLETGKKVVVDLKMDLTEPIK